MSNFTDAWLTLYDAQTEAVGNALTATIIPLGANGPGITDKAIFTQNTLDQVFAPGGLAEAGGWTMQMLASAFPDEPAKGSAVIALGVQGLQVIGVNNNNGILYIQVGDFVSQEGN